MDSQTTIPTTSSPKKEEDKKQNIKRTNLIQLAGVVLLIVFVNIIGYFFYLRFDLTAEKRYTLAPSTKKLLKEADDIIYFKVYLEGDFPADFKQLRNETREMLNQFRAYNKNIEYEFINPNTVSTDRAEQNAFYQRLVDKNIQPTQINERKKDGMQQLLIFPAAEVLYREKETVVQLLSSQRYVSEAELLNNSIQNLEYALTDGIRRVTAKKKNKIGFVRGYGEFGKENLFDIQVALSEYYNVENVEINERINSLTERVAGFKDSTKIVFQNKYDALIITRPTKPFSDKDLFILDQYVMYGGKILWLIDPLDATMDSLERNDEAIAMRYDLRLENLLFKYGVRVNPNLIMDIRNVPIPMAAGNPNPNGKPQITFMPWYYFPEIIPRSSHPIVKNINAIKAEFISSIDTIENDIKKTVLLTSSEFARTINAPAIINLQIAREEPDERLFNKRFLPVAVLLEGNFSSAFKNRLDPTLTDSPEIGYLEESSPAKMIVVSDGDMIKNRYNYKEGFAYPIGYDQYTGMMYGNKEFILNCVNYLCDDDGYLSTRSREVKLRKLNVLKIKKEETKYQLVNIIAPILLVSIFTGALFFTRKRFFTK